MVWPFRRKAKADLMDVCYGPAPPEASRAMVVHAPAVAEVQPQTAATSYVDIPAYSRNKLWTGEKYPGGIGVVDVLQLDYSTLRALSAEMFRRNIYTRGILRRLITNIVNTGLHLEAAPDETVLGLEEDSLREWSELVEKRFELWASTERLCDHTEAKSFGELQAMVMLEALVVGDVLCMFSFDQRTRLPRLRLINGASVQTPMDYIFDRPGKNRVRHGVELDANGRHVAYHVRQEDGTSKRILAYGPKTGRRIAWLVYGTENRLDDVRGEPILSVFVQSLKEIDRYRDATSRKAIIASLIALVKQCKEAGLPSKSITGMNGAPMLRKGLDTTTDTQGNEVSFQTLEAIPGILIEGLKPGEEIKSLGSQGTDEKFGDFEAALIQSIAWCLEIPPECLRLTFSHNYSASQAANNEFALFLKRARDVFARRVCQPVYTEWLFAEVTIGKLDAAGLLESRRVASRYDIVAAWLATDWAGQIKPAADVQKVTRAYQFMVDNGFMTRTRAMRELSGMKYVPAMKQLRKDNELLAWAREPLHGTAAPEAMLPEGPGENEDEDERDDEDEREDRGSSKERTLRNVAYLR